MHSGEGMIIICEERPADGQAIRTVNEKAFGQSAEANTLLVNRGIEMLKGRGCLFIIVLGHQEYYPRFGFARASGKGIASQWDLNLT